MQYVHVRNLDKYHPGYKDRTLQWAKIYINMACGDPDTEMIENEVDWARLIKIILLELRAKKPLPNNDSFWLKKGFDIKKRPISLTLKMLHNFLEVVTETEESVTNPLHREEKRREDKEEDKDGFCILWSRFPNPVGKKEALRHYQASVKTDLDYLDITKALNNYLQSEKVQKGFIQNGSTWFNNWRDYVDITVATGKSQAVLDVERLMEDARKTRNAAISAAG